MVITYHQKVYRPQGANTIIPHAVLCEEIVYELEAWGAVQPNYYCDYNATYFFLYLDNGDRLDIETS